MTAVDAAREVVLDGFFRGPATTANGGYAAGVAATLLGGAAEVRLLKPPPIERVLAVQHTETGIQILDGDVAVITARPRNGLNVSLPQIDLAAARHATASNQRLADHAAPTCVVCGPGRADGLRIFPGTLTTGMVATQWRVPAIDCNDGEPIAAPIVWAALDCPGGWSFDGAGIDFFPALITQRVDIIQPLRAGTEVIVVGWETGREERKLHARTAVVDLDGEPLAVCEQTCIAVPVTWAQ